VLLQMRLQKGLERQWRETARQREPSFRLRGVTSLIDNAERVEQFHEFVRESASTDRTSGAFPFS
jgi:phage host-nuclease inhibitor protein Gam